MAPTLIAFRVAKEPPPAVVDSASPVNPLSRLTFRRTGPETKNDTNSQTNCTRVSTFLPGPADAGENIHSNSVQIDAEEWEIVLDKEDTNQEMATLVRIADNSTV